MSRRWRLLVAAAVAVAAAPGATQAMPGPAAPGVLVLSGRGATYAEITLREAVRIVPMHLAPTKDHLGRQRYADGWSWAGCGRLRGFYLRPLGGDPLAGVGAVDFAELRSGPPTDVSAPGGPVAPAPLRLGSRYLSERAELVPDDAATTLRPGRYRAFLLGEGACEVRVPLGARTRSVHVRTVRPAALQWAVTDLSVAGRTVPAVPVPRLLAADVPVTIRPGTLAVGVLHRAAYQAALGQVAPSSATVWNACFETEPQPFCSETPATRKTIRSGEYLAVTRGLPPVVATPVTSLMLPIGSGITQIGVWHAPGWLPPGPQRAKVFGLSGPSTTALQAVMFALDL